MFEDTANYILDIVMMRPDAVMCKTAEFIKRSFRNFGVFCGIVEQNLIKIKHAIHHGVVHTIHGFKALGKDSKFFIRSSASNKFTKYSDVSYNEQSRLREIRMDLIKFIPFSFFVVVPFAELLFPAWLVIFPNSIPSQFLDKNDREKKFQLLKDKQKDAAEKLLYIWPNYLTKLAKDPLVPDQDKAKIKELAAAIKGEKALPTDLLQYRNIF